MAHFTDPSYQSVCLCVPLIFARRRLGKNVSPLPLLVTILDRDSKRFIHCTDAHRYAHAPTDPGKMAEASWTWRGSFTISHSQLLRKKKLRCFCHPLYAHARTHTHIHRAFCSSVTILWVSVNWHSRSLRCSSMLAHAYTFVFSYNSIGIKVSEFPFHIAKTTFP